MNTYQNQHGRLKPVGMVPGSNPIGGNMEVLRPAPAMPEMEDLIPLFPPDYWPNDIINLCRGGRPYWIQPRNFPLVLAVAGAAGAQSSTIVQTQPSFSQLVLASMYMVYPNTGGGAFVPDNRLCVDVRRRNMNLQDQTDTDFVAVSSVFGSGQYPHPFAMPMLLPPNSPFLLEFRNMAPIAVTIFVQFLVIRVGSQYRGS